MALTSLLSTGDPRVPDGPLGFKGSDQRMLRSTRLNEGCHIRAVMSTSLRRGPGFKSRHPDHQQQTAADRSAAVSRAESLFEERPTCICALAGMLSSGFSTPGHLEHSVGRGDGGGSIYTLNTASGCSWRREASRELTTRKGGWAGPDLPFSPVRVGERRAPSTTRVSACH